MKEKYDTKGMEELNKGKSSSTYLGVGREEGQLQRPAVLDPAGDHAGHEQPEEPPQLLLAVDIVAAALDLADLLQGRGQLGHAGLLGITPAVLHGRGARTASSTGRQVGVGWRGARARDVDGWDGRAKPEVEGGF